MTTHGSLVYKLIRIYKYMQGSCRLCGQETADTFSSCDQLFFKFFLVVWLTWRSIWTEHRHPIRAGIPHGHVPVEVVGPSSCCAVHCCECAVLVELLGCEKRCSLRSSIPSLPFSVQFWMFNQLFWGSIWIFSVVDSDQPSEYSLQRKGCLIHVLGWGGIDLQVLCVLLGCQCPLSLTGSLLELLKQLTWCPDGTGEYRLSLSEMIT